MADSMHVNAQESSSTLEPSAEPTGQSTGELFAPVALPIPPFTPGVVLVGMRGDVAAAASVWDGIEVTGVEPLDLRAAAASASSGDVLVGYKLNVPSGTEWGAIESLRARGDVAFAEPDWLAEIAQTSIAATETPFVISDTLYREQWYLQRIGISRAWAVVEASGDTEQIEIAVIDTGVDFNHPDLANRLLEGRNYLDINATAMDDNGHGTHVSGLIAAAANGAGMVGSGRSVKIIPLKALNNFGNGGVASIGQAIRDAADEGVHIINLSLTLRPGDDSAVLRLAVEYAVSKGVLVIAASGNQGASLVSYPAAYPGVLAVGATTYTDTRANYSNRGQGLDLMAPGGSAGHEMLSTWTRLAPEKCPNRLVNGIPVSGLRMANGGMYCESQMGTSMATGVVSGVAALVWSMQPDLDADQVQEILLETAAPIAGNASDVGRGRLDAARAVRFALESELVLSQREVTATARGNGTPISRMLFLGNSSLAPLTIEVTPTSKVAWVDVVGPRSGEARFGEPLAVQVVFTPTAAGVGSHASDLRITATDEEGGQSVYVVGTRLDVLPSASDAAFMFMPWTGLRATAPVWAVPGQGGRTYYSISSDSSIVVNLPFTMTVEDRNFTDMRVFADGFVVAPASDFVSNFPNHCLDNQIMPSFAVYGWWSDLDLDENSTISTFQPDSDHFAIEYNNFLAVDSLDARVTFQIVLQRDGGIALNYANVPKQPPASLTVGASAVDGRFYNQITCFVDATTRIGEMPHARQSFFLRPEDLY